MHGTGGWKREGGAAHDRDLTTNWSLCRPNILALSGLQDKIVAHTGAALDIAPRLGMRFDLVFIDADKREYPAYYRMAMESLVESGSYPLADNILWYGKVAHETPAGDRQSLGIKAFNDMVMQDDRVENVILPIRGRTRSYPGQIKRKRHPARPERLAYRIENPEESGTGSILLVRHTDIACMLSARYAVSVQPVFIENKILQKPRFVQTFPRLYHSVVR